MKNRWDKEGYLLKPLRGTHMQYCLYSHALKVPELQSKMTKFQCLLKTDTYWLASGVARRASLTVFTRLTSTEFSQIGLVSFSHCLELPDTFLSLQDIWQVYWIQRRSLCLSGLVDGGQVRYLRAPQIWAPLLCLSKLIKTLAHIRMLKFSLNLEQNCILHFPDLLAKL